MGQTDESGMNGTVHVLLRMVFKALLGLILLIVLVVFGFGLWLEYGKPKRPPGAPPPGYEGRLKYPRGHISNSSRFDNIPVDLWFGKRDGNYDTTHLRIASDYFGKLPFWHGEYATLNVVWPSLRSPDEEVEIRKKDGQPDMGFPTFKMTLNETGPSFAGTDRAGTEPIGGCTPLVRDERRGVRHCNEPPYNKPGKRWMLYWPLDESIRTPFYNNPPRFQCRVVERPDGTRFDRCFGYFSYNTDFHVLIDTHEELAVAILADFPKLIDFLHTLEATP